MFVDIENIDIECESCKDKINVSSLDALYRLVGKSCTNCGEKYDFTKEDVDVISNKIKTINNIPFPNEKVIVELEFNDNTKQLTTNLQNNEN